MRRIITATLLVGTLSVPAVATFADPASAICFGADGEEKIDNLPYQGLGTLNTTGAGQTDHALSEEGVTVIGKARFTNISDASGKIKIKADDNGTPNFRVRYALGNTNITDEMKNGGHTFKNLSPDERTRALTVRITAKPGSDGSERVVYLDGSFRTSGPPSCALDRVGISVDLT